MNGSARQIYLIMLLLVEECDTVAITRASTQQTRRLSYVRNRESRVPTGCGLEECQAQ